MVSGSFMVLRSLMVFYSNSRSEMNIDRHRIKNVDMNITGKYIKHIKGLFISHLVGFWPCLFTLSLSTSINLRDFYQESLKRKSA